MAHQEILRLRTARRGTLEITREVAAVVSRANVRTGLVNVFTQHTSCSLIITENADPSVRRDLEMLAQRWAPDGDADYVHDAEGDDDMAAHARTVLTAVSLSVPIGNGEMLLGTWQGIFLWEHRTHPHAREVVITVTG
ncbi:secondary thiamine-phosphate synthase enzyme YjbQ [Uliginosibacterium sp. H3]|uniref:Secondary thiamine-phosphate synthase enzyme YjbQ n=1 Tax=Uliginosibacterium silvisoli TaxID=3114758 RepID=A0ABU6JY61_9RHOO|nr:secondary thiamine-phosphate synthase enzyme YjbQ [Uliginosibacterium sp. H3]